MGGGVKEIKSLVHVESFWLITRNTFLYMPPHAVTFACCVEKSSFFNLFVRKFNREAHNIHTWIKT